MINEGAIRLYGDGLQGNASLLDAWLFLPPEITNNLSQHDKEEMEDFVMACIQAKKPDCILCMGAVAANALERRRESSSHPFWRDVQVAYASHPSRTIHYEDEDAEMRKSVLDSIKQACTIATRESQLQPLESRVEPAEPHVTSVCEDDLFQLMELLLCCCIKTALELSERNTTKGKHCFKLLRWHTKWFEHVCQQAEPVSLAQARLIPVFRALNSAIRVSSWFDATYTLHRTRILGTLAENISSIEADCYLVSTPQLHLPTPAEAQHVVLADKDDMSQYLKVWKERPNQARRGAIYIGFAD